MNQVALVGRITKDPVLRTFSEGRMQTSFIIAVNRNFKNLKGEIETDFVLCTVWGKIAENTVKTCGKGSLIGIGGRIQSRTYERGDQSRVYVTEVVGEDIRFISTKPRSAESTELEKHSTENGSEHFHLPKIEKEELPIL
ncbi:single-stranded DNA-binding protein [Sporosarcina siberiensis]|uniref:Single-stranded DNA-binding protein n=1 Tax=Sporosarcina siberiensis TaxID=1365606 RepID=A0ABW4SJN9_9BACL